MSTEDEEYDDDPIRLFNYSHYNGSYYNAPVTNPIHHDLKYKLSLKSCYMLPLSFFDIPSNIEKLNECLPLRVKLVDYYKHPWYFKKADTVKDKLDSNNCIDIIDLTVESKLEHTLEPEVPITVSTAEEKRREMLNNKLNIEIIKALCQKDPENVDFKRNKGLIGLTITRRVIVSDSTLDDDCDQNNMKDDESLEQENEATSSKNSNTEQSVAEVKYIERTTQNRDLQETEEKQAIIKDGKTKVNKVFGQFDTKCSLKNVSVELLNKILSLKKAKAMKTKELKHLFKEKHSIEAPSCRADNTMQNMAVQKPIISNISNLDGNEFKVSCSPLSSSQKSSSKPEALKKLVNKSLRIESPSSHHGSAHSSKKFEKIVNTTKSSETSNKNKSVRPHEENRSRLESHPSIIEKFKGQQEQEDTKIKDASNHFESTSKSSVLHSHKSSSQQEVINTNENHKRLGKNNACLETHSAVTERYMMHPKSEADRNFMYAKFKEAGKHFESPSKTGVVYSHESSLQQDAVNTNVSNERHETNNTHVDSHTAFSDKSMIHQKSEADRSVRFAKLKDLSKNGKAQSHKSSLQQEAKSAHVASSNNQTKLSSHVKSIGTHRSTLPQDEYANLYLAEVIKNSFHQSENIKRHKKSKASAAKNKKDSVPNNASRGPDNVGDKSRTLKYAKNPKSTHPEKIANDTTALNFVNKTNNLESVLRNIVQIETFNHRGKYEIKASKKQQMPNLYGFAGTAEKSISHNVNRNSIPMTFSQQTMLTPDITITENVSVNNMKITNHYNNHQKNDQNKGNRSVELRLSQKLPPKQYVTTESHLQLMNSCSFPKNMVLDQKVIPQFEKISNFNEASVKGQETSKVISDDNLVDVPVMESPERKSPILQCTKLPKKTIQQITSISSKLDGRSENYCQNQVNHVSDRRMINQSYQIKTVPDTELKDNSAVNIISYNFKYNGSTNREHTVQAALNPITETVDNIDKPAQNTVIFGQSTIHYTPVTASDNVNNIIRVYPTINDEMSSNNMTMNNPKPIYPNNQINNEFSRQNMNAHMNNNNIRYTIPVINTQASQFIIRPQKSSLIKFPPLPQYAAGSNPILKNMLGYTGQLPLHRQYAPDGRNLNHNMYPQYHTSYNGYAQMVRNIAPNRNSNEERFWNYNHSRLPHPVGPAPNGSIIGNNTSGVIKKINIPPSAITLTNAERDTTVKPPSESIKNVANQLKHDITVQNYLVTDKPANTKDEMLEELDRIVNEARPLNYLKRPYVTDKTNANLGVLNPSSSEERPSEKRIKPNTPSPKQKQRQLTTLKLQEKGYSPPILPIPTYQNLLSRVNTDIKNRIETTIKYFSHRLESFQNKNTSLVEKITNLDRDTATFRKCMKKITIDDYKRRIGNMENEHLMLVPKTEVCNDDEQGSKKFVENEARNIMISDGSGKKSPNVDIGSKTSYQKDVMLDLGYVSDTPGKRTQ